MGIKDIFSSLKRFKNQDYTALKKKCIEKGELFEDPEFPAAQSSIGSNKGQGSVEWKRPHDICESPRLFVDGASAGDVTQGQLGNCWLVAACSVLAGEKVLWNKVIPDYTDQEWDATQPKQYAGIFHFRFWRHGDWTDVVIDDRLPTINGQLMFMHSMTRNEFWSALLEKAYAKMNGCYENLDGGNLCDALVDFTSGVSETVDLKAGGYDKDESKRQELFKQMKDEMENHALMCAAVAAVTQEEMEARTEMGLVKGHAYGITAVKKVNIGETGLLSLFKSNEKILMVRLRNPWGEKEWEGPFSDGSAEWSKISEQERERIGLTFENDGEFWMTFEDFIKFFTDMSICHLINTSYFTFTKTWSEAMVRGKWEVGIKGLVTDRSGGCLNHKDTFLRNPQYRFDITTESETFFIQLSQKDSREKRHEGGQNLCIGFHIMKVEDNRKYRCNRMQPAAKTSDYIRSRAIFLRLELTKGRYVLVPTTFAPGECGEYMLRVFTDADCNLKELVLDAPPQPKCPCFGIPRTVCVVNVVGAIGLEKQDTFGSADPYCIIKCDRKKVRSEVMKDNLNPQWNVRGVFYRSNTNKPIKIEIWNHGLLKDKTMGKATLMAPITPGKVTRTEVNLFSKGRQGQEKKPGKVTVEVISEDDMASV